jgi:hypothetical protein
MEDYVCINYISIRERHTIIYSVELTHRPIVMPDHSDITKVRDN